MSRLTLGAVLIIAALLLGGAGVVGAYIRGGKDKEIELREEFKKEVALIHAAYKAKADEEVARQARANDDALKAAKRAEEERNAELATLQADNEKLRKAAESDPKAESPSLSLDAVRRLNARRVRSGAKS